MNSKTIIGAIVGGLILFIWQTLSWTMLNIHGSTQKYSAKQAEILDFLKNNIGEDGTYFMPTIAPGASSADHEKLMTEMIGKPWAEVSYHSAMEMNMNMNMGRGLLVDIIVVFLLMWLLAKNTNSNFVTTLTSCLAVGFIAYLTMSYTRSIWYEGNTIPDMIDAVAGWGLVGSWLGFWMNRK